MIKADDKRDAAGAKKNQQSANRAWDRFGEKEKMSPQFYIGASVILITVIINGLLKNRKKNIA